jgi:hypothetical protein
MGFARKRPARRSSHPGIETLEGRAVPAVFHAATIAELRADLATVSNSPGPNTIILQARAYRTLSNELVVQNAGDLTIMGSTSKKGSTQLVGGPNNRVLEIDGGNVTITGVLLSGTGIVNQGGGLNTNNANVTLQRTTVSGTTANEAGGGIFAQGGTLNLDNCAIVNNTASGAQNSVGGGLATVNTNVTISRSRINNNEVSQINNMNPGAGAAASGGGIAALGGTVTITHSSLSNNRVSASTSGTTAMASGGGFGSFGATVTVDRSNIANNSLTTIASQNNLTQGSAFSAVGGSQTITNSTVSGNVPSSKSQFAETGASVVLENATVDGAQMQGKYTLGDNGFSPGG